MESDCGVFSGCGCNKGPEPGPEPGFEFQNQKDQQFLDYSDSQNEILGDRKFSNF